jgi:hypothetical protein
MNLLTSDVTILIGLTGIAISLSIIAIKFADFLSDLFRDLLGRL